MGHKRVKRSAITSFDVLVYAAFTVPITFTSSKTITTPATATIFFLIVVKVFLCIHSFSILSDDRSKASSKTMPPHSAI